VGDPDPLLRRTDEERGGALGAGVRGAALQVLRAAGDEGGQGVAGGLRVRQLDRRERLAAGLDPAGLEGALEVAHHRALHQDVAVPPLLPLPPVPLPGLPDPEPAGDGHRPVHHHDLPMVAFDHVVLTRAVLEHDAAGLFQHRADLGVEPRTPGASTSTRQVTPARARSTRGWSTWSEGPLGRQMKVTMLMLTFAWRMASVMAS